MSFTHIGVSDRAVKIFRRVESLNAEKKEERFDSVSLFGI